MKRNFDVLAQAAIRRKSSKGLAVLVAAVLGLAAAASSAQAASNVGLGTADSFAVLGGQTVTNTGPSVINGDVGVSPGSSVIGFPPGIVNGVIHATDGVANQAQLDLTTAYNDAAGRGSTATISADLAGNTLVGGVYTSATSMGLSGALTLDAQGDPDAVFIFQAGSTLTAGPGSQVLLIGGAQSCNVFWQVGSSATIDTGSQFVGNIMALTSISMNTGATLEGSVLARNGAVTLDTNTITKSHCANTGGSGGSGGSGTTTTPTGESPAGSNSTNKKKANKKKNQRRKHRGNHRRPHAPSTGSPFTG
jgi:Ice-binding-like